jgi:two-component system sensor histidine kinase/response regulator
LYCNQGASKQVGYCESELLTMSPLDLLRTVTEAKFRAALAPLTSGRTRSLVLKGTQWHRDGTAIPVEVSLHYVEPQGESARCVALVQDVTERQRQSAALQESETKYRELVQHASSIIVRIDDVGRITFMNEYAQQFFGYSMEAMLGQNALSTILPPHATGNQPLRRLIRETRRHPERYAYVESEATRWSGERVWVAWSNRVFHDEHGRVTDWLCVGTDLSVRKRYEAALVGAEERIRLLLDSVGEGIYGLDHSGNATFVNPAAARMLGSERAEDLIGKPMHALFHHTYPDGRPYPLEACPMYDSCKHGTTHIVQSDMFWRLDGTSFPVEYTSTPVRKDDKVLGSIVTFRDVTERQRTQQALEENMAHLRAILSTAPDGIVTLDTAGHIVSCNPASELIFGYAAEEMVGKHVKLLVPDSFRALHDVTLRNHMDRGTLIALGNAAELNGRRKSGVEFPIEISLTESTLGAKQTFTGIIRDISRRKEAEAALRESERRFRLLLDLSPGIIYRLDRAGKIEFISAGVEKLGYHTSALIGRPFEELVHPEDRKKFAGRMVEQRVGERATRDLEVRLVASKEQGSRDYLLYFTTVLVSARGVWNVEDREIDRPDKEFMFSQGIAYDISERKAAEEQLRILKQGIEQSPVSVVITNRDGTIEYVNPKFCTTTGYTQAEVLGKNPRVLKSDMQPPPFYVALWETLNRGEAWQGEFCNLKKNGELYWESASISPVRDDTGTVKHFVAVKEDITERKATAAELQGAKEAAEAANQAKSMFLANMSHEIRTPMNAILGFTQLLLRDRMTGEAQREQLGMIARSGEHLLALINDILDMSKIEAGKIDVSPADFDLHAMVEGLRELFEIRTAANDLSLTAVIDADVPRFIFSDEGKLRQVLINLLGNAVKFTESGGIAIRASCLEQTGEGIRLQIEVEDTGIGIPAGETDRVFQIFEQAHAGRHSTGGTGLGLAISRRLVTMLGGDMWVRSEPGRGSVFGFSWLTSAATTPLEPRPSAPVRMLRRIHPSCTPPAVAVVDDDATNRFLLGRLLRDVGFVVWEASDGQEAVRLVQSTPLAIVLMDLQMPVMDGYDSTVQIRATDAGRDLPIVAVSASILQDDRERAEAVGANGFMAKPIQSEELFEILGRLTGITYAYEDAQPTPHTAAPATLPSQAVLDSAIQQLPGELRARLLTASVKADIATLAQWIEEVATHNEPLAAELRRRADSYDCEGIVGLLRAEEEAP